MTKRTRFARAVEKEYQKWLRGPQEKGWLSIAEIRLQREHAAVVRKVKQLKKQFPAPGYQFACADLLAWLHERGR